MFRIFLKDKLIPKKRRASRQRGSTRATPPTAPNRRSFERFAVDHKHLTLMNEQDILAVREISATGFSTDVSPRAASRLEIGDVYSARIRYLGEIHDLNAKVSWKEGQVVGFELQRATRTTHAFLKRLLHPVEIARSLHEINPNFIIQNGERKSWYHGDHGTDLYLWRSESGALSAWQLVTQQKYLEWQAHRGLKTGNLVLPSTSEIMFGGDVYAMIENRDRVVDPTLKQFATDVFMAIVGRHGPELIETITQGD